MKALSIRQPWAELIIQGRKTLELRTWRTNYRGRFAVHASQTVEVADCIAYDLDPAQVVRGAVIGTVELVNIVELDAEVWGARRAAHLARHEFRHSEYGWELAAPQRLPQPVPLRGRMSLFSIPDEVIDPGARHLASVGHLEQSAPAHDPEKPFELRVVPRDESEYSLALYQWPVTTLDNSTGARHLQGAGHLEPQRLTELSGDILRAVADHILAALRHMGYKPTDLSPRRRQPFLLDEEIGLRLGLLFLAIKPLTRLDRVAAISEGLRMMPAEEAYYWFSKCTARESASNAQRALRMLLAGE